MAASGTSVELLDTAGEATVELECCPIRMRNEVLKGE